MNSTPTSPARAPLWQRLFRSLALTGLALVLTVVAILAVLGYLPQAWDSFESLSSTSGKVVKTIGALIACFVVFLPLGSIVVLVRMRWLTGKILAAGWLAVLPVLGWLVWDDPAVRQPLTIEEFSPAFPGAEQSYAVLMQYSKETPSEEAKAFATFKPAVQFSGSGPQDQAKWLDYVTRNREALGADWAALAPQRRWLGELAAFDRLGDLTPAYPNANLITFQVWRTLSQRACAMATLQALDGHGDDAIATLLPVLEVGRKLQLSSRSLVRTMIGVVVERMATQTATVVLDQAPVSATSRARLATALEPDNAPVLARRLVLVDFVQMNPLFHTLKLGDQIAAQPGQENFHLRKPLNFFSGVLINPNATLNLLGDHFRELADLAETRKLVQFAERSEALVHLLTRQTGMKNVGGRLLLFKSAPAYTKIVESHWKTADLRAALRARLAAPGAK